MITIYRNKNTLKITFISNYFVLTVNNYFINDFVVWKRNLKFLNKNTNTIQKILN